MCLDVSFLSLCFVSGLLRVFLMMEIFSLEEDDSSGLFLTQTPSAESKESENKDKSAILGDPFDFMSPCVSLVTSQPTQYSDISDDDFEGIPSSQPQRKITADDYRYV